MSRCSATTKSGKRCRANATGSGKCIVHQSNGKARELGLKGVEARRKAAEKARSYAELAGPTNPQEIFQALAILIGELRAGTTDPTIARAMATVSHTMLKAHEVIIAEKQQLDRGLPWKDGIDPADLTDDEWVAKYASRLIGPGAKETIEEPFPTPNSERTESASVSHVPSQSTKDQNHFSEHQGDKRQSQGHQRTVVLKQEADDSPLFLGSRRSYRSDD
jgi:hypothetical protein